MKENKNGGAREGAGRPRKFKDPVIINFTIEKETRIALKTKYQGSLNSLFNDWVKKLLSQK